MISMNFSKDAELLDYEFEDYDTVDQHETGISSSRMRLPTRYDISKYYQRNTRDSYGFDPNGRWVKRNKGEYGHWKNKAEKDLLDFSDDFDWQITYSFPNTKRDNITDIGKEYGGRNVTYRRLYLILCEHFNNKEYFVDRYFNDVYPETMKPEVDRRLDKIKKDLLAVADKELEGAVVTKSGTFDKRYKVNKGMKAKLVEYEKFAQQWEDNEGIDLARLIAEDIKRSLATGAIPLQHSFNSLSTQKARARAGIESNKIFYATSRLIDHIQLYVKIGGNRKWKTSQGILV